VLVGHHDRSALPRANLLGASRPLHDHDIRGTDSPCTTTTSVTTCIYRHATPAMRQRPRGSASTAQAAIPAAIAGVLACRSCPLGRDIASSRRPTSSRDRHCRPLEITLPNGQSVRVRGRSVSPLSDDC
jgi:hypothetical protein